LRGAGRVDLRQRGGNIHYGREALEVLIILLGVVGLDVVLRSL